MISGYCKCSFPASMKCEKCGEKLCGNCFPKHTCKVDEPAKVAPAAETKPEQSEAVKTMTRKPYGPRVKK